MNQELNNMIQQTVDIDWDSTGAVADEKGGAKVTLEPGPYPAVLAAIVYHGEVKSTYEGKERNDKKITMVFQLAEKDSFGNPVQQYKEFGLFFNDQANLRQFMEQWRGKKYSDEEAMNVGFKPKAVIGQQITLVLSQATSKTGKEYMKIASCHRSKDTVTPSDVVIWDNLKKKGPVCNVLFADGVKERVIEKKDGTQAKKELVQAPVAVASVAPKAQVQMNQQPTAVAAKAAVQAPVSVPVMENDSSEDHEDPDDLPF